MACPRGAPCFCHLSASWLIRAYSSPGLSVLSLRSLGRPDGEFGLRIPVRPALWSQLLRDCPLPRPPPCRRHTHTLVLNTHVHTHYTVTHMHSLTGPQCQLAPPDSWGRVCPHHGEDGSVRSLLGRARAWACNCRALLTTDAGTQALCLRQAPTVRGTPAWHSLCSLSSRFCPVSSLPASLLII